MATLFYRVQARGIEVKGSYTTLWNQRNQPVDRGWRVERKTRGTRRSSQDDPG